MKKIANAFSCLSMTGYLATRFRPDPVIKQLLYKLAAGNELPRQVQQPEPTRTEFAARVPLRDYTPGMATDIDFQQLIPKRESDQPAPWYQRMHARDLGSGTALPMLGMALIGIKSPATAFDDYTGKVHKTLKDRGLVRSPEKLQQVKNRTITDIEAFAGDLKSIKEILSGTSKNTPIDITLDELNGVIQAIKNADNIADVNNNIARARAILTNERNRDVITAYAQRIYSQRPPLPSEGAPDSAPSGKPTDIPDKPTDTPGKPTDIPDKPIDTPDRPVPAGEEPLVRPKSHSSSIGRWGTIGLAVAATVGPVAYIFDLANPRSAAWRYAWALFYGKAIPEDAFNRLNSTKYDWGDVAWNPVATAKVGLQEYGQSITTFTLSAELDNVFTDHLWRAIEESKPLPPNTGRDAKTLGKLLSSPSDLYSHANILKNKYNEFTNSISYIGGTTPLQRQQFESQYHQEYDTRWRKLQNDMDALKRVFRQLYHDNKLIGDLDASWNLLTNFWRYKCAVESAKIARQIVGMQSGIQE